MTATQQRTSPRVIVEPGSTVQLKICNSDNVVCQVTIFPQVNINDKKNIHKDIHWEMEKEPLQSPAFIPQSIIKATNGCIPTLLEY